MIHLVAGAAGFIGSAVVDRLVDSGQRVVALDDLSTGRLENLERAIAHGRAAFVFGDVVHEPTALAERVAKVGSGPGILYAAMHPAESAVLLGDLLGYRSVAVAPGAAHGVLEVGTAFGPRMRPQAGNIVADVFDALARSAPLPIAGSEDRLLHLTWIDDVARSILALGESPQPARRACEGTIVSVAELVDAVAQTVGLLPPGVAARAPDERLANAFLATYRWFLRRAESAA